MNAGSKRIATAGAVVVAAGIAAYFLLRGPSATTNTTPQRRDQGSVAQQQPDSAQPRGQQRRRAMANRVVLAKVQVQTVGDRVAAVAHYQAAAARTTSTPERNYLATKAARLLAQ